MCEYDAEDEARIHACVKAGLNPLTHGQGQYLLDQLDLARDAVVEASRLSREIAARVDRVEANRDETAALQGVTRELLKKARAAQAEARAGVAEDRNVIGGLHTRLREMEGEMQDEIDVLRKVAVAAAQYRATEETPLAGEGMIQLMGARQVLDDALREWVEFKGYDPKDFDSNG